MRFSLEVIRARKGDCLMLHYGTAANPRLMLIDGGPSNVFGPHLAPRIAQLRSERGLADTESLRIDLLMVSHVDDDHIKGILDMTAKLRRQKERNESLWVRANSLWHNSFDEITGADPKELQASAQFGQASMNAADGPPPGAELDVAQVLASIGQGHQLRDDASKLRWRRNRESKGKLILATKSSKPVSLRSGPKLTIVGPMRDELKALQDKHDAWILQQEKKRKEDPTAALAAFTDPSIPNLSSIVVLADAGGRRILFTGDARGDKILDGLKLKGLLDDSPSSRLRLDVLKVPHHGSDNNVTTEFFRRLPADHYVFSGNGEHGNPERKTLEMLFKARNNEPCTLHFTYPIDEIDIERKKDWKKQQAKERKRKQSRPSTKVRPNWSVARNGLARLLDQKLAPSQSVRIVEPQTPHLIDLLAATVD